jgi:xylulokinase
MGYVIGIDVGSQSAKAVLVDGDGAELANTSVSYGMGYPASGWAEQDPASWEQALGESVRELRTMTGTGRDDVTMLALACQVDGLVDLTRISVRSVRRSSVWTGAPRINRQL